MSLRDLALAYASRGWPVFPLEPRGKQPLGRLVPHGLKDASTDKAIIERWWAAEPEANIGIPTGIAFDVADVDTEEAMKHFTAVCGEHDLDPRALPRVATGRGGRHVLWAPSGLGNRAGVIPGMDWRGKGGYVVAPGSVHANGELYRWIQEPNGSSLPAAPAWLLELLDPKRPERFADRPNSWEPPSQEYIRAAVEGEIRELRSAPEGERNDSLNRAAFALGQMVGAGWIQRGYAEAELKAAALAVGLEGKEIQLTIRSGLDSGSREPRRVPVSLLPSNGSGFHPQPSPPQSEKVTPVALSDPWPEPPASAAHHGLAGRLTALIKPYVESNEASVLVQFLAAFGVAAGMHPHQMIGATRHAPVTYVGLVGPTSHGRKGTAWDPVETLFRQADPDFAKRILSGIGSGERLVWLVRDPSYDSKGLVTDSGAPDRRLLLQEPELARLLTVVNREGSTLSAYLRSAYDGKPLRNEVKTAGSIASLHHIGLIGHSTIEELRSQLTEQQVRNGLANRITWVLAKREQLLPDPEVFEGQDVEEAVEELRAKLAGARSVQRLERSREAKALWRDWYVSLPEEGQGITNAITARPASQATRLSMIYALTDAAAEVGVEHLEAAIALWDHSVCCVRHIWGSGSGDVIADRIFEELAFGPLTMTQLYSEVFGRNTSGPVLERAVRLLESRGMVVRERVDRGGPGRPALRLRRTN